MVELCWCLELVCTAWRNVLEPQAALCDGGPLCAPLALARLLFDRLFTVAALDQNLFPTDRAFDHRSKVRVFWGPFHFGLQAR